MTFTPCVSAQVSTWIGPASGSWSLAANWSAGVVPNSSAATALVDNGNSQATTAIVDGNFSVGTLGITANDQVTIANSFTLVGNSLITNTGTILINSTGSNTALQGSFLLNGGGVVRLSGANAQLGTNGGSITNANNTIRGEGAIGGNNSDWINQGTINADVNGSSIFIDPRNTATAFINSGLLTATNGATLRISGQFGGGVNNTGGTIGAQNGSAVSLESNIGISGGTFTSSSTGVVHTSGGQTIFVTGTANTGNWTLDNNSDTNYSGDFLNTGSVNFTAGASNVRMLFNTGTTNLTGGGVLNLSTTGGGQAQIGGGNGRLVNVNNTIRGAGSLGANNQHFTNGAAGVVQADVTGQALFVDPVNDTDGFINQGTMRATNGGVLQFSGQFGGGMNNTGGTISANGAGSEVQLFSNIGITGGTFSTSGGGVLRTAGGQAVFVAGTANTGNWTLDNSSDTNYSGDFLNTGSVNIAASASNVRMLFNSGTVNLSGGGTFNLSTSGAGQAQIGGGNGLLVNVNNTLRGAGAIGANNQRFINGISGVIQADVAGQALFIDPINEANGFINHGIMRATSGGLLQLSGQFGGEINNATGTISASGAGSEVQFFNNNFVLGGSLTTTGGGVFRVVPGQTAFLQDNTLAGNLIVDNNAGLIFNPGAFTNSGNVNLNAGTNTSSRMGVQSGGTLTLSGGGMINMTSGNAGGVAVLGSLGAGTIVNLNNTIRGSGNVAANNNSFINAGTISADIGSGGAIRVDPFNNPTLAFNNSGTMQSSNGGALQLVGDSGGGINNTGGRIIANGGSQVQLFGSIGITGGTFSTAGTGSINVTGGQTAFIADAANTGAMVVSNNSDLHLIGSILNDGSITLTPGASAARIGVNGGSTNISGSGSVILAPGTGGAGVLGFTSGMLTLGSSQTVRGTGNLASNNTAVINNGAIIADQSGLALFVDPVNVVDGFVNNNVMTATNGGVLQFTGQFFGGVTNNGTISAQNASLVQLFNGIGISGGTFASSGTGAVEAAAGQTVFIANTVNTGTINVQNNAVLNGSGTLVNNGTIAINPGANSAIFNSNSGTLAITGTGNINMNAGTSSAMLGTTGGTTIDFGAGQTVRGRGTIGNNNTAIINRGLISAAGGGEIFVDPVNAADGFVNFGTMRAETGSQLRMNGQFGGGVNSAAGFIDVNAGGTLRTENDHNLAGGTIALNGTWNADTSSVTTLVNFRGAGTLNVTNSAQVNLIPNGGNSGTSRAGTISINTSGKLDLADNDLIATATALATMRSMIVSGRTPTGAWNGPGINSSVAAAAAPRNKALGLLSGSEYISVAGTSFDGFTIAPSDAVVKFTWYGDTDFNGRVNFDDYVRIDSGFNNHLTGWLNGDFNYDGAVNFDDYVLIDLAFNTQGGTLRRALSFLDGADRSSDGMSDPALGRVEEHFAQFGSDYAGHFLAAVPEPTSVAMIAMALALIPRRRRHK